MAIRINQYKGFVIKILLPSWIMLLIAVVGMPICYILVPDDTQDSLFGLIFTIVAFMVLSIVILLAKFGRPREWYLFYENTIQICKKNGTVETIKVSDVEIIKYHPFRLRYLITIFFGELNECGAWRLYFKFKNGETKAVGLLDLKSVETIKEIYGDLIFIC